MSENIVETNNNASKLRFIADGGEVFGDWVGTTLGKVAEIIGGGTPDTGNKDFWGSEINWFTPAEISEKYSSSSERKISKIGLTKSSAKIFPEGTVMLTTRATLGRMSIASRESTTNQGFQNLIAGKSVLNEFIYYQEDLLTRYLNKYSSGSTFKEASKNIVSKFPISLPSLPEQEKIAGFLSVLDEEIVLVEDRVSLLRERKRGFAQQLFGGGLRFKREDGSDFPDWVEVRLGDVLKEISHRTTKNNQHEALSSTTKGLFLQTEYFNKQVASENNIGYKVVERGNIILSPQNLWLGNITFNDKFDQGIVSPSYKVFSSIETIVSPFFMKQIIKQPFMTKLYKNSSEQGASIVRRNLDLGLLLSERIALPSLPEQELIANFLSNLDKEIEVTEAQLKELKQQKQAYLQKLLP